MGESISQISSASSANLTDLIPCTQGFTGVGTGVTRVITPAQLLGIPIVPTGAPGGRTLANRFSDFVYGKDYEIAADGVTDDTAALQAALAAATQGKAVLLPAGFILVSSVGVSVPPYVTLIGESNSKPYTSAPTAGTVIVSKATTGTAPVVSLGVYSTLAHLVVYGPGTDGFGGGTSRPAIQLANSSGGNLVFDVTGYNSAIGIDFNYQGGVLLTNSQMSCNSSSGLSNAVDSHIIGNIFNSNSTNISMAPGANHNMIIGNRIEFSGAGPGIIFNGNNDSVSINSTATTSSGSPTLTFSSTSAVTVGVQVCNHSHVASIPAGTYVIAKTSTTVTLSVNVVSTVSVGDVIEFYFPGLGETTVVGNTLDRAAANSIQMSYCRHMTITGNLFERSSRNGPANTSTDAHLAIDHCNTSIISGNTSLAARDDDNESGNYSPSWGVWDGGYNYACGIKNNIFVYNPVNGTNGGGINSLTTFATFNTDNIIAQANPFATFQP